MVITNMYMSVLIKQMTHTSYIGSIESLEDVLNQNLIPLMFERSSSIDHWKQSSDETLRLILRMISCFILQIIRSIAERVYGYRDDSDAVR